jgi:surface protein
MIFRLTGLDSVFVSTAVAAGVLIGTSATEAHRDVLFRGSSKDGDGEFQSANKNMNGPHVPRKLADKKGVVDKKGIDLSLQMESREEKTTINIGRNRQLRNTNTKYFVSPTDDAGKDREDYIAVDTTVDNNIIDIGILHGNAVPFNAKGERNLDQDGTMDRDQYCIETCGLDRKEIPADSFRDAIKFYRTSGELDCGVAEEERDYRCPIEVKCWDTSQITNMDSIFFEYNYANNYGSLRCWDVSSVTTMRKMFKGCYSDLHGNIQDWDVSSVLDMYEMFYHSNFNGNIQEWDVSSVTDMEYMLGYTPFNQPIDTWSTSSVTSMGYMFGNAKLFNQNLDSWDVSSVTTMKYMFYAAHIFNGDIESWSVSSVTTMNGMFWNAYVFNGEIGSWDVSSVINMERLFLHAYEFDQYIGGWDVSSVNNMRAMFKGVSDFRETKFNQFIGNWDVSSVESMEDTFMYSEFNQPLQSWNVSSVNDMGGMFRGAKFFNQPVHSWDVSSVTRMGNMFKKAVSFNQPVDVWDVSSVDGMYSMFDAALSFNQCLSSWAGKTNDGVLVSGMFRFTACPAIGNGTPDEISGPWCQGSTRQCYEATCVDDPEFQFNGDNTKNCEWVALGEASEQRCAKEGVFEACSQTCNPVCFGGCDDDSNFQLNGVKTKTCNWVAKQNTEERCKKPGAMDACRATCNPKCAAVAVDCTDDEDFQLGGLKAKSCEWVAKQKTDQRCKKPGVMDSCRRTCNPSCGCRDSTNEFEFQGSMITCEDLDLSNCDKEVAGSDEFSDAQLVQLNGLFESLLTPIHQRLDAIEDAVVEEDTVIEEVTAQPIFRQTYRDLCPYKCKKCVDS